MAETRERESLREGGRERDRLVISQGGAGTSH